MSRYIAGIFALVILVLLLSLPRSARAAESYDNCTGFILSLPAVIVTQGTWCMKQDLATGITSGDAITINTNNVTIDCNNFKLGGLAAGIGSQTVGIFSNGHLNTTVRHCNVRGFFVGIDLIGGGSGGHLIEENRFDNNLAISIYVEADGSTIRHNLVFDTGGGTSGVTFEGIYAGNLVDIIDNTISGVMAASGGNGDALGIYTSAASGTISGNRIRGLVPAGTGSAYGDFNSISNRVSVHDNDMAGPGAVGLHCIDSKGSYRNNLFSGFTIANENCTDGGGNAVVP